MAYNFFVNQYVAPLLHANTRPDNLYSGFRSLLSDESRRDELAQLRDELERETTDPYDSHPALPDRLAQLEDLPPGEALSDTRPAREVLSEDR
ncbi:MAG: peptidase, partial [Gemmatimonadetes bacterium]|nr:peptidase [Gemmatimonadota bacterium]